MTEKRRDVYVYLREIGPGEAKHTTPETDDVNLDYDAEGELLGVEVLGALHVEVDGIDLSAQLEQARAVASDAIAMLEAWAILDVQIDQAANVRARYDALSSLPATQEKKG